MNEIYFSAEAVIQHVALLLTALYSELSKIFRVDEQ